MGNKQHRGREAVETQREASGSGFCILIKPGKISHEIYEQLWNELPRWLFME